MSRTRSNKEPFALELQIEKRSHFRFFLLIESILVLFTTFFLKPLYILINADALLSGGALPYIFELVILLFNILFFTLSLAASSYALIFFDTCRSFAVSFLLLSLLGKIGDLLSTLYFNKSLQVERFVEAGVNFLLEALLFFVLLLIISAKVKAFYQRKKAWLKLKKLSNAEKAPVQDAPLYPFAKFYSKDNLLQRCALTIGIVLPCSMIVFNLLNDIIYMILYGISDVFRILVDMLLYYALDLLMVVPVALISYLASLLFFAHCFKKKEQIKSNENT